VAAACVLLTDNGPDTEEARKLLRDAGISFAELPNSAPGRYGQPAPKLYAPGTVLPHLQAIRSWVAIQRPFKNGNGSSSSPR